MSLSNLGCYGSEVAVSKNDLALIKASTLNYYKETEELLNKGCNINKTIKQNGMTPLMLAAKFTHLEIVNLLVNHRDQFGNGPEIDLQDNDGKSALMHVCDILRGSSFNPCFFLECYLNENEEDYSGYVSFCNPYDNKMENSKAIIDLLLDRGIDHTIQDKTDKSFVDLLESSEREQAKATAQNRWNTVGQLLRENRLTGDLIERLFFSFYLDEKNDDLAIDKKGYKNPDQI